jgi:ABC-type Mn2+/Zn2+ transport system permease subunit
MNNDQGWRARALLAGIAIGALTGLVGAYLLVRRAEAHGSKPKLDAGEGIRIGVLVMGLLRQVAMIAEGDDKD